MNDASAGRCRICTAFLCDPVQHREASDLARGASNKDANAEPELFGEREPEKRVREIEPPPDISWRVTAVAASVGIGTVLAVGAIAL